MTQPIEVELEAGKTYLWCACGKSQNQPWCDGSHQGTGITPVSFKAGTPGPRYLCVCKRTFNQPFCDGSHNDPE